MRNLSFRSMRQVFCLPLSSQVVVTQISDAFLRHLQHSREGAHHFYGNQHDITIKHMIFSFTLICCKRVEYVLYWLWKAPTTAISTSNTKICISFTTYVRYLDVQGKVNVLV